MPDADRSPPLRRTIAIVGLMGAGKTAVGRRLAKRLGARFADSDEEIVQAAGMSIPDLFETYGEAEFRVLERRVLARLAASEPMVLALGGGAFMNEQTREALSRSAVTLWLRADVDTLVSRTNRKKGSRPLLAKGDPKTILARLIRERDPIYALADHVIDTGDQPVEEVVEKALTLLPRARRDGEPR